MGILGTITGFLSGGDTLKQVGGIIDDLHNKLLRLKYLLVGKPI